MPPEIKKNMVVTVGTAIAGYKRAGFAADPKNPEHVQAYITMRQWSQRISGQSFMEYLNTHVKKVGSGATVLTQFWAVPKENFKAGLPDELVDSLVDPEKLQSLELVGGGAIDKDMYHIIDQQVQRHELGKNVLTLQSYVQSSTSYRPAVRDAPLTIVGMEAAQGDSAHELGARGYDGAAHVSGARGSGESGCAMGHGTGPQNSAHRGLKRKISDDSEAEDEQTKKVLEWKSTMKSLREEIENAMCRGQWYSEDQLQHLNVHDLIDELLLVLSGMPGENKKPLLNKITRWLEREFMTRPIFKCLHRFEGLFARMQESGADPAPLGTLIDALANVPLDTMVQPNVSKADVVARTQFRKSLLYSSFVTHRAGQLIEKAKETTGDHRLALLEQAKQLPSMPGELLETLAITTTLVDDKIPLQRVIFLAGSKKALKLAMDWEPTSVVGTAAQWMSQAPPLATFPFEHFLTLALVFVCADENLSSDVICPILRGWLGLYEGLQTDVEETWAKRLLEETLCNRLGKSSALHPSFSYSEIPQTAKDAFKAVQLFMSFVRGELPQWWVEWKQKRAEEKVTKKAKKEGQDAKDLEAQEKVQAQASGPKVVEHEKAHAQASGPEKLAHEKAHAEISGAEKVADDAAQELAQKLAHEKAHVVVVAVDAADVTSEAHASAHESEEASAGGSAHASAHESEEASAEGSAHAAAHAPHAAAAASAHASAHATSFKEGDIVRGIASKNKDKFHMKKCIINAVLSRHYKVELLEGTAKGTTHRFLHAMVEALKDEKPTEPVFIEKELEPKKKDSGDILRDIEDLW